jgi:hypothetical protein
MAWGFMAAAATSHPLASILVAMGTRITLMSVGHCRDVTAARLMPHQEETAEGRAKLPRTRSSAHISAFWDGVQR